ncbi:PC-Esterase [Macleaya cordata]|uniref:PC-Esterase n=1 Tax=Macleaya cordata TaxID=56857 RepID=A0A200R463_MACCD|nr:PC-Esterase [Macleaya cordata]
MEFLFMVWVMDYNCSIDFVQAPFLVRRRQSHNLNDRNRSREVLRLDLMEKTSRLYRDADVIVFNSWHWWNHEKTSRGENYYQEGSFVYLKLETIEAYKKALTTWGRWVDKNIDVNRTQVVFRGYSVKTSASVLFLT